MSAPAPALLYEELAPLVVCAAPEAVMLKVELGAPEVVEDA